MDRLQALREATRGTPFWHVTRHPDGGWTPLVATIGDPAEPRTMISDPSFADPFATLESIAPANTDKIFSISADWNGTWIIGDLADIAAGRHKEKES